MVTLHRISRSSVGNKYVTITYVIPTCVLERTYLVYCSDKLGLRTICARRVRLWSSIDRQCYDIRQQGSSIWTISGPLFRWSIIPFSTSPFFITFFSFVPCFSYTALSFSVKVPFSHLVPNHRSIRLTSVCSFSVFMFCCRAVALLSFIYYCISLFINTY